MQNFNVHKKSIYVSLPYMGHHTSAIKRELTSALAELYPYVKLNFIFKNPLSIGSLFCFKDILPELMRSGVVYNFTCPKCNFGTYIGCTNGLLKVCIDSHWGVSHRTGLSLTRKEDSAIRMHSQKCKYEVKYQDFKILGQSSNKYALPFLESLFIKQCNPSLNSSTTSIPLKIA